MPAMIEHFICAGEKVCEAASIDGTIGYEAAGQVLVRFIKELEKLMPGLRSAWHLRGKFYTSKGMQTGILLPDDMNDWWERGEMPHFAEFGEYQTLIIFREEVRRGKEEGCEGHERGGGTA